MVSISTHRHGLIVVATVVNDNRDVTTAIGVTADHAAARLLRKMDR